MALRPDPIPKAPVEVFTLDDIVDRALPRVLRKRGQGTEEGERRDGAVQEPRVGLAERVAGEYARGAVE